MKVYWYGALVVLLNGLGCSSDEVMHVGVEDEGEPEFRVAFTDLDDDLELHYDFDSILCDLSGCLTYDISGHLRHGVVHGATSFSSPWGHAASFDGVNDWIAVSDNGALSNPTTFGGSGGEFTISARVRVDDADKSNRLCQACGPVGGMHVGHITDGRVARATVRDTVHNQNDVHRSGADVAEGEWMQVTMVVDATASTTTRFQFDCDRGTNPLDEMIQPPDPYSPNYSGSPVADPDISLDDYGNTSIGDGNVSSGWFGGDVDDLRIWSRALSDEELAMLCADPEDPPCEGIPFFVDVDPPDPPAAYTLPVPASDCNTPPSCSTGSDCGCTSNSAVACVTNATTLATAMSAPGGVPVYTDVVLCDGSYTRSSYLQIRGHHLWAESLGGALLNFGIRAGGGDASFEGPELHGLAFAVETTSRVPVRAEPGDCDPDGEDELPPTSNTNTTSIFQTFGAAGNPIVEDCTFTGNGVVGAAIDALDTIGGLQVARVEISDFARYGIVAGNYNNDWTGAPMVIQDVSVERVADPDCWDVECGACGYFEGSAEVGLYLGDTADVDRIRVRDVRAAGVETVRFTDGTTLHHLDIDRIGVGHSDIGVGVYFEGITENTTLSNFCIGPLTRNGVTSEWDHCTDDPDVPGPFGPRGFNNTVTTGLTQSWLFGVAFDQGTVDSEIANVYMANYHRAGILMSNNYTVQPDPMDPGYPCPDPETYDDGSSEVSNVFLETEVSDEICDVTRGLASDASPLCE